MTRDAYILPVLLQQRHEEVDGLDQVGNDLAVGHFDVALGWSGVISVISTQREGRMFGRTLASGLMSVNAVEATG